jgi:hypothetical protein
MNETLTTPGKSLSRPKIEQREGMYVLPMGNGTVADNASILEVKHEKINDAVKKQNVAKELEQYLPALEKLRKDFPQIEGPYQRLAELHNLLWDIEDQKRLLERGLDEDKFVEHIMEADPEDLKKYLVLCRLVSKYNDERASVKKTINEVTGSKIVEAKSHATVS